MAKSLLLNVLVDVLGNYVEGLTKENLKLGVWSGKIELLNMKLKSSALDNFNLPITVTKGSLNKLKLKIPWANLESKPVRVIIDGVYLEAIPLDVSQLSPEELKKSIHASKVAKLRELANAITSSLQTLNNTQEEKAQKTSYLTKLTTKIIDNIEVIISNIHIRYEDSTTIHGRTLSTGITIESLSLLTTDENWNPKYVARDSLHTAIRKLGELRNFSLYWKPSTESFEQLDAAKWETKMQNEIALIEVDPEVHNPLVISLSSSKQNSSPKDYKNYIIEPHNSLSIKIIHRDISSEFIPKVDIAIDSSTLSFQFDKLQYLQLLEVQNKFSRLDRLKRQAVHRPRKRPTEEPLAWWKYAYLLITGKDSSIAEKFSMMTACMRNKSKYINLIKRRKMCSDLEITAPTSINFSSSTPPSISVEPLKASDLSELDRIEELLPLPALLVFTEIAIKDAVYDLNRVRNEKHTMQKAHSVVKKEGVTKTLHSEHEESSDHPASTNTFMSWFYNSKPSASASTATNTLSNHSSHTMVSSTSRGTSGLMDDTNMDDDLLMEQLEARLSLITSESSSSTDLFTLRITSSTSATLNLTEFGSPIASLLMSINFTFELRSSNMLMIFDLRNLMFEDTCSKNAVSNYIIKELDPHLIPTKSKSAGKFMDLSGNVSNTNELRPLVTVMYDSKFIGDSFLRITAMPIEIVFNELCIQKLIAFLIVNETSQSNSPAHSENQYEHLNTGTVLPPSNSALFITIECYAPTFVIPERFDDDDSGCIVIDSGYLLLKGMIGNEVAIKTSSTQSPRLATSPKTNEKSAEKNHLSWDIALEGINVAMPDKISTRVYSLNKFTGNVDVKKELKYLVRPFDISLSITFGNGQESSADLIMLLTVHPNIRADLSALKIIRLLSIVNTILRCFSFENTPATSAVINNDPINENQAGKLEKGPFEVGNNLSNMPLATKNRLVVRKLLQLIIVIPEVNIAVLVDSRASKGNLDSDSEAHFVNILLSNIEVKIIQRQFDIDLAFVLDTMCVSDSFRSPEQAKIIWTTKSILSQTMDTDWITTSDPKAQFIQFSIIIANSMASSHWKGHQIIIDSKFLDLCIGIDAKTLQNLVPFFQELSKYSSRYWQSFAIPTPSITLEIPFDSNSADLVSYQPFLDTAITRSPPALEGVLVTVFSSGVSIYLMEPIPNTDSSLEHSKVLGNVSSSNPVYLVQNSFKIEAAGLFLNIDVTSLTEIRVNLKSFDVVDHQPASVGYFYNTVVSNRFSSANQKLKAFNQTKIPEEKTRHSFHQSKDSDNLLTVHYKESSQSTGDVSIFVRDVTGYISLDIVLNLVQLLMANVTILQNIINILFFNPTNDNSTKSLKAADSNIQKLAENEKYFSVSVNLVNPRILLLENPEDQNSKAIVCTGNLRLHYMFDLRSPMRIETRESFHISLQSMEVFVLTGMVNGYTQQIITPTGFDFHLNRVSEQNIVLSYQISLSFDNIVTRVSFNDIILASTIISRRSLAAIDTYTVAPKELESTNEVIGIQSSGGSSGKNLVVYDVHIALPKVSLSLVNDYHQHNIPVCKFTMEDFDFELTGAEEQLQGGGGVRIKFDYYNISLSHFEPLVETWMPVFVVNRSSKGLQLEISNSNMLQINLSGAAVLCFKDAYILMEKIGQEGSFRSDITMPDSMVIYNMLGETVEISDNFTNKKLIVLEKVETIMSDVATQSTVSIPRISLATTAPAGKKKKSGKTEEKFHRIIMLDMQFTGQLAVERKPLIGLPININKFRSYVVQPKARQTSIRSLVDPSTSTSMQSNDNYLGEPIVEVAYENSRYYPLQRKWDKPWENSSLDVKQWTDAHGQQEKKLNDFYLPKNYEWIDEWKVDLSGKIGKEIDQEGWEYGTSFGLFTLSSNRRTKQALDTVRRRRWIRTRAPIRNNTASKDGSNSPTKGFSMQDNNENRPLVVIWDVAIGTDGSREITIRSPISIRNDLPFDLEVHIFDVIQANDSKQTMEAGKKIVLKEKETFFIPLLISNTKYFRIRPRDLPDYEWSPPYRMRKMEHEQLASTEQFEWKELICTSTDTNEPGPSHMIIQRYVKDKSIRLTCSPAAIIRNWLPCHAKISWIENKNLRYQMETLSEGQQLKMSGVGFPLKYSMGESGNTGSKDEGTAMGMFIQIGEYVTSNAISIESLLPPSGDSGWVSNQINTIHEHPVELILRSNLRIPSNDKKLDGNLSLDAGLSQKLMITTRTEVTKFGVLKVTLYSKCLLVDKSRSKLAVRSKLTKQSNLNNESEVIERRNTNSKLETGLSPSSFDKWIVGAFGCTMFQSFNQKISLGILMENADRTQNLKDKELIWQHDISALSLLGSEKTPVEFIDFVSNQAKNLALYMIQLPGELNVVKVLRVVPCFTIINCLDESMGVLQSGVDVMGEMIDFTQDNSMTNHAQWIESNTASAWHKMDYRRGSSIIMKLHSSEWSMSPIDINEVGSYILILPTISKKKGQQVNSNPMVELLSTCTRQLTVLHVEVKIADLETDSYLNIVVWKPPSNLSPPKSTLKPPSLQRSITEKSAIGMIPTTAALSIKNETPYYVVIQQNQSNSSDNTIRTSMKQVGDYRLRYDLLLLPGDWRGYGWINPADTSNTSSLKIVVITKDCSQFMYSTDDEESIMKQLCDIVEPDIIQSKVVDILKIGQQILLSLDDCKIILDVQVTGSGKIIHLTTNSSKAQYGAVGRRKSVADDPSRGRNDMSLQIDLSSIGISIFAEAPTRRELFVLHATNIRAILKQSEEKDDTLSNLMGINDYVLYKVVKTVSLDIMDIQLDNYCEMSVFPVVISSINAAERREAVRKYQRNHRLENNNNDVDKKKLWLGRKDTSLMNTNQSPQESAMSPLIPAFITFTMTSETPNGQTSSSVKLFAFRILEIQLSIDSSTILMFIADIYQDYFLEINRRQDVSTVVNEESIQRSYDELVNGSNLIVRTDSIKTDPYPYISMDVLSIFKQAQQSERIYFELFVTHPIKFKLNFQPITFPRKVTRELDDIPAFRMLRKLQGMTALEDLEVRMYSFIVNHIMESVVTLQQRIFAKYMRDSKHHLAQIAGSVFGSLSIIGKPAGLYKNIGTGVQDFFYEPYLGLMTSPKQFAEGLGRGTGSLITGVVSGAISSTASIVSSATSGVSSGVTMLSAGASSLISHDEQGSDEMDDFQRRREERIRQNMSNQGGLVSGLKTGGESFVSGISSGIAGLVTKPYEETKKSGAIGFFKGVGLGVMGAAVKPLVGVSDGISSVAQGVSQQMKGFAVESQQLLRIRQVRYRRALERSPYDVSELLIVPFNSLSTKVQNTIHEHATSTNQKDSYVTLIDLGFQLLNFAVQSTATNSSKSNEDEAPSYSDNPTVVVLSELYIQLIATRDVEVLWRLLYGDISHFKVSEQSTKVIELHCYKQVKSQYRHVSSIVSATYNQSMLSSTNNDHIVHVICANTTAAIRLYSALLLYEDRFGNPSVIVSVEKSFNITSHDAINRIRAETIVTQSQQSKNTKLTAMQDEFFEEVEMRQSAVENLVEEHINIMKRVDGYQFGSINGTNYPKHGSMNEKEIIKKAEGDLFKIQLPRDLLRQQREQQLKQFTNESNGQGEEWDNVDDSFQMIYDAYVTDYHRYIDEITWILIHDWKVNHSMINPPRCCACVLINYSQTPIQILKVELLEGASYSIIGVSLGYHQDSHTIARDGGAVVIFAYGFTPTLLDLAHVKCRIVTSACTAQVSTRKDRTTCDNVGGYSSGYWEKSLNDSWGKYVLVVS